MTTQNSPQQRRLLPMLNHVRGKRSAVTCALKCNNACLEPTPNCSDNHYFKDVIEGAISRRAMLGGVAGAALVVGTGATSQNSAYAAPGGVPGSANGKLKFNPIAPVASTVDDFNVPSGFKWEPIIRWGDPLFSSAPEFDINNQTAEAQAQQFGYNNDYLTVVPDPDNPLRGILVNNHEYINPALMFPNSPLSVEQLRVCMMATGLAVVELERKKVGGPWNYVVDGRRNRRITADTTFELDGPAAGSDLLKTKADPEGRFVSGTNSNCSGGYTPWGTVLSGEENFDGFFFGRGTDEEKRYGIKNKATSYGWERADDRFNANVPGFENEAQRFGYVVEVDPEEPTSTPRKHTALGRFKHEGANIHVDPKTGKVAAYMGDDQKFEYMYKFVSSKNYIEGDREHNKTLLSEGSLFVGRFTGDTPSLIDGSGRLPEDGEFDGVGEWIQLTDGNKSLVPGMSIEEVLVFTRQAADKMNPTKMDRPEDVEPSPYTGKIYAALTNNTDRGMGGTFAHPDEANPRANNRSGHVIEITEDNNRVDAKTFTWNLLLVCGDPAGDEPVYFAGYDPARVSPISCPDNVAFDSEGNLWLTTDGAPDKIQKNDGLFKVGLEGANRGKVEQFLSVPREAETCGPVIHDQEKMVYVCVQHPGEDGSFAEPHSYFPDYVNKKNKWFKKGQAQSTLAEKHGVLAHPRPSVVQIYR